MNIEIKSEKTVYDGFFKIVEAEIEHERFNGSTQTIKRLCFERGDAVAAVVYDPSTDEFIFTQQFRYPAYKRSGDATMIELVAGMTKPGEHHKNCLLREINEELGYAANNVKYLGCYFLSPGGSSERIHIYFAELGKKNGDGGGLLEENEDIRLVRISKQQVKDEIFDHIFNDAKTQLGLMMALSKEIFCFEVVNAIDVSSIDVKTY